MTAGRALHLLPLYAHTPPAGSQEWHPLEDHLLETARLAAQAAAPFRGQAHAFWAGLLHDLGKAQPAFQSYLAAAHAGRTARRCPHAIWGAALTFAQLARSPDAVVASLAMPIDGHHRGLVDLAQARQEWQHLLDTQRSQLEALLQHLPKAPGLLEAVSGISQPPRGAGDLWTRMVFSALIDADRVDTARHFAAPEETGHAALPELERRLDETVAALTAGGSAEVAAVRREARAACVQAAEGAPGFYSLTVPTGGGKTLASIAFALRHALLHGKRRVVVAIPYTSIIQQSAHVYRQIFGAANVLEHHSQVEPEESEHLQEDGCAQRSRLAAERWTHPIVVTTTVQLFESLFTDRPSRARKLHQVAGSVIVLDEFQAFPPELMEPTLDVLQDLVQHYGVTVLVCTATQPALESLPGHMAVQPKEVIPRPGDLFGRLQRVHYEYRPQPLDWEGLAEELEQQEQVLVILNTRRQAVEALRALGAHGLTGLCHLSTLLCSAHRANVLDGDLEQGTLGIRDRLRRGEPVRLVSTQVVEAGVDLDFPVVYRAVGPLDRIIQAAGRCNREGGLERGRVVIFQPRQDASPTGPYQTGIGLARGLLEDHGAAALQSLEHLRSYFSRLYQSHIPHPRGRLVQQLRRDLAFEQVAAEYRLIDRPTLPVVVDYKGRGTALAQAWVQQPSLARWRELQPYVVDLYRQDMERARKERLLRELAPGMGLWEGRYDDLVGIRWDAPDPADLVR